MLKPERLKSGDTIGIVAPGSWVRKSRLQKGIKYLRSLGFKIKLAPNVFEKRGYLSGTDEKRALTINHFFADKKVNAIFCARGGYGSLRILDLIDYSLIKKNPKIFLGYSDITVLHWAILKNTNLVTFHGPMVGADFDKKVSGYVQTYWQKALFSNQPIGKIENPARLKKWKVLSSGKAEGILIGGNLTLISRLLGTEYQLNFKDKILFLEDLDEPSYHIDGMLAQLKLAGVFEKIKGLILGEFVRCGKKKKGVPTLSLNQVFQDYFGKVKFPVIYPVACGHGREKLTLPLGVKAVLDTSRNLFAIVESGVK